MLRFSAHVPGSSLAGGPPPGGSDVDTMVLFVSSSQARNTIIIEVSKCVPRLPSSLPSAHSVPTRALVRTERSERTDANS